MNARKGALLGGLLFAVVNIISFVGETYEHRDHAWQDFGIQEFVLVCAGPITFAVASFVGLKHARVAGQWMIIAGLLSAVMFILRLTNDQATLLAAVLIWIAPLLVIGCLWLRSAGGVPVDTLRSPATR